MLATCCLLAFGFQTAVEVPFRITDDALVVDAKVNGRPLSLMFDSGYSGAVIVNDAIDVGPVSGQQTIRDFVGEMQASTVDLQSLQIGPQKLNASGLEIVLQPMARMSQSYHTHTDGILGLRPLTGYVTEINFEKSEFIFHPRSYNITTRQPDGKRTFLAKLLPIGDSSLEMAAVTSTGQTMNLALDTGNAFFATTHRDVLERVGLWPEGKEPSFTHGSMVASGSVMSWSARLKNLQIFGVPVPSSVWDVIDLPSSTAQGDGTIGYQFLRNFNITFDYERRRVWLENFTGKVSSESLGETGVSAGYDPVHKRVVVFAVAPGSPAEKAGVKVDDELIGIGDIDMETVNGLNFERLKKMLAGPIGSTVDLSISRNGEYKRFHVVRADLVNETS